MSYIDTVRAIFRDIMEELKKNPEAFTGLLIHLSNGEEVIIRIDRKEKFQLRGNYLIVFHLDVNEKFGKAEKLMWRIPLENITYVIQIDPQGWENLSDLYPEIYEANKV